MTGVFRDGRAAFALTVLALAYGVALLVWVVAVPGIDGQTLLEYGGPGSLAITSQAALFSLAMWWLLRRKCTTGSPWATRATGIVAPLFVLWSVMGALSIAAGAFPAAVLLLVATSLTPSTP